jgi:hypothetical protein
MTIPEPIRALIATGPNAHLTTLNPDGGPQVTVVWVGIEDEEFVIGHMGVWQKVKNMRRDPRVVLSLLGPGKNPGRVERVRHASHASVVTDTVERVGGNRARDIGTVCTGPRGAVQAVTRNRVRSARVSRRAPDPTRRQGESALALVTTRRARKEP